MMIKPIQTLYKGYRFRSRLEARWAVFLDGIRVKWQYEPEGYLLPDGTHYLPDFKLTLPSGLVTWYEVKPIGTPIDKKLIAFQKVLHNYDPDSEDYYKSMAMQVSGDPIDVLDGKVLCPRCASFISKGETIGLEDEWSFNDVYLHCERCDFTTPCGGGHPWEETLAGHGTPDKGMWLTGADDWASWSDRVEKASRASRRARFEHGESGAYV